MATDSTPQPRPRLDVTGRPLALRDVDLDRFFHPESVAVVGASDTAGSAAAMNFSQIRTWAQWAGVQLYPVNPNRAEVFGLPCHASLLDIPGDVDVVVILVSAVEAAVAEAVQKKVGFVVVFAAGFAEAGVEGQRRQVGLEALIAGTDVHLLGPNTTLNAFQPFHPSIRGRRIGLITQSGHQGRPIYQAQEIGIGLAGWAPTGNEADLESADFIRYFADDSDVGVIAGYIEGFKDGRSLVLAADHALHRGVPLALIKVGRTEVGRSWAQSHSGHLAGSDAVMQGAFDQFGVVRVDTLDELLDTSMLLARCPEPTGDGVCIYSISGGTGAHMADLAAASGLRLPELAPTTQARLGELIPPYLRVSNPVDSGGHATADERGPKILDAILDDPEVAVLIVPIPGSFSPISEQFARDLVAAADRTDKPICVVWGSPLANEEAYRDILLPAGLPVFRSARNCLDAVKAYLTYHDFRRRYRSPFTRPQLRPSRSAAAGQRLLAEGGALSERRSKELLAAYGIEVSRDVLVHSGAEAARAAEAVGYPVVLKACGPSLLHKSELGLVAVGLRSAAEVRRAYSHIAARAEAATAAEVEGVLVCGFIDGGVETIIGVSQDDLFGPAVMFGVGGTAVEVYRDVVFRVPPFTRDEARRMITSIRGLPLLRGARGAPKVSITALVDVVMRVQRLAQDLAGDLAELDINPLLALPDRVVALDALAIGRHRDAA